jgi:LysM repeat protein
MHAERRFSPVLYAVARLRRQGRSLSGLAVVLLALALTGCQVTIGAVATPTPGGPALTTATPQVLVEITPVDSPTPAPPSPTAGPPGEPIVYKVQSGDSLSSIADKFGVTVDDIVKVNNIANPNEIYAGQELIIPPKKPGQTTDATPTKAP